MLKYGKSLMTALLLFSISEMAHAYSNNLVLCLAWKESGFYPSAQAKWENSTAVGLLQVTRSAVEQINDMYDIFAFKYSDMTKPDKNIEAGTIYLKWRAEAEDDAIAGINSFGTGKGYSENIFKCEKCLDNCAKNGATCRRKEKQKCLHQIHR